MVISKGYVSEPCSHRPVHNLPGHKGNILINNSDHACLADFSLLTIVSDQSTVISSWTEGGSIPWMSPELLDPDRFGLEGSRPTKESDCYALGMVAYEVLSGRTPFAGDSTPNIIRTVLEGRRPERPRPEEGSLLTDAIWAVLELCWQPQPRDRTSAEVVLQALEGKLLPTPPQEGLFGSVKRWFSRVGKWFGALVRNVGNMFKARPDTLRSPANRTGSTTLDPASTQTRDRLAPPPGSSP